MDLIIFFFFSIMSLQEGLFHFKESSSDPPPSRIRIVRYKIINVRKFNLLQIKVLNLTSTLGGYYRTRCSSSLTASSNSSAYFLTVSHLRFDLQHLPCKCSPPSWGLAIPAVGASRIFHGGSRCNQIFSCTAD